MSQFNYMAAPEMTDDEHWWVQRFGERIRAVPYDDMSHVASTFRWPAKPLPADANDAARAFWDDFEASLTEDEQVRVARIVAAQDQRQQRRAGNG